MIQIQNNSPEKAILIGIRNYKTSKETANEHLDELEELLKTAGGEAVLKVIQDRDRPDSKFFIGKGKAEEIAQFIEDNEINLIVFDDDLSPMHIRNLERLFNKKVIDRSGLILDIFALRARSKEAKTQVELAQMEYMFTRLTRAWTHLSKQYGGIGTKGPGETQIETDRRIIKYRISVLKEKLQKIEEQRKTQTKGRKEIVKVTIVGYTNAGKSTLFNFLTNAEILAEDKLFATLDSTTRKLALNKDTSVLLSDTVGFIRKLPAHLVASFKSTLAEVNEADLIIHLVDVTHPFFEDHISVVDQTLEDIGSGKTPQIKVFNKIDIVEDVDILHSLNDKYPDCVHISAIRGLKVDNLLAIIEKFVNESHSYRILKLNHSQSKLVSQIYEFATAVEVEYEDEEITVSYKADDATEEKIRRFIK